MQRKIGVLIFTHGSRLKEGNEIMVKLVDQVRRRLGYAFFLVPGSHLREDIPFIFEQTLKKFPGVTYEISPPMMSDPTMIDFVAKHVKQALGSSRESS